MGNHTMKCVACQGTENVALDGWSDRFREVIDISNSYYVVSRRYRHRNCPVAVAAGKKATVFSSLNSEFFGTLPAVVQAQLNMVVYKKSIFSSDMKIYAREMQQYTSFRSASAVHKTLLDTRALRREERYLLAMKAFRDKSEKNSLKYIGIFAETLLCFPSN
jgi:hypothetical protein